MSKILNVIEYNKDGEGLAIIEDEVGRFAVTKEEGEIMPLESVQSKSTGSSEVQVLVS